MAIISVTVANVVTLSVGGISNVHVKVIVRVVDYEIVVITAGTKSSYVVEDASVVEIISDNYKIVFDVAKEMFKASESDKVEITRLFKDFSENYRTVMFVIYGELIEQNEVG